MKTRIDCLWHTFKQTLGNLLNQLAGQEAENEFVAVYQNNTTHDDWPEDPCHGCHIPAAGINSVIGDTTDDAKALLHYHCPGNGIDNKVQGPEDKPAHPSKYKRNHDNTFSFFFLCA